MKRTLIAIALAITAALGSTALPADAHGYGGFGSFNNGFHNYGFHGYNSLARSMVFPYSAKFYHPNMHRYNVW